jgi:hypothetical protein
MVSQSQSIIVRNDEVAGSIPARSTILPQPGQKSIFASMEGTRSGLWRGDVDGSRPEDAEDAIPMARVQCTAAPGSRAFTGVPSNIPPNHCLQSCFRDDLTMPPKATNPDGRVRTLGRQEEKSDKISERVKDQCLHHENLLKWQAA